jgi:hypothetical protein
MVYSSSRRTLPEWRLRDEARYVDVDHYVKPHPQARAIPMSLFIALDAPLMDRCTAFGAQMIHGYATRRMTDRKVYDAADKNIRLQAMSKMAECAFAICMRHCPDDLDWFGEHKNGEGHDLAVNRFLIDIKHTERGTKLIWPLTKVDDFWSKDFNCLALVIGSPPVFEIAGIVSKHRFYKQKQVAEYGDGSAFAPGTWYMPRARLSSARIILDNGSGQTAQGGRA